MNGANTNTSGKNQAMFRLKPHSAANDRLPNWMEDELQRRGYVVIDFTLDSNVVISPTEPEDKTVVWFKSDINGIPQGGAMIYNSQTGKWEPINAGIQPYVPPARRYGKVSAAAGASQLNIDWADLKTNDVHINLTPTTMKGDGATFNSPPGSIPNNYGWLLSNLTPTGATINFYGIPTGGLTYLWEAVVRS